MGGIKTDIENGVGSGEPPEIIAKRALWIHKGQGKHMTWQFTNKKRSKQWQEAWWGPDWRLKGGGSRVAWYEAGGGIATAWTGYLLSVSKQGGLLMWCAGLPLTECWAVTCSEMFRSCGAATISCPSSGHFSVLLLVVSAHQSPVDGGWPWDEWCVCAWSLVHSSLKIVSLCSLSFSRVLCLVHWLWIAR